VRLKVSNRRIWFRPFNAVPFTAGTPYSFKVSSQSVTDASCTRIDGEFNGPGVISGNGAAADDLVFLSKRDKTAGTARFFTVGGNIDVSLDATNTPLTFANFLHYANSGLYDFTYFHRAVVSPTPFIIQGGGFSASLTNDTAAGLSTITAIGPVKNEFHTSNTRGTIAMAKIPATDQAGNPIPGGGPDSATDQFFFNLGDNSSNLDNQNGGVTVFGTGKGPRSPAALDAIAALPAKDLSAAATATPDIAGNLSEAPVVNSAATAATLHPLTDLAIIRRVAVLNKVVAFPIPA